MALIDFQSALGHMVQAAAPMHPPSVANLSPPEQASLAHLARSPGLRVTAAIQRSWCEGRAARAARLTLSSLPVEARRRLLERWVRAGGGTASLFEAEAKAFLTFIARRLPQGSPARMLCEIERATICASEGVANFMPPPLPSSDSPRRLRQGRYATLVRLASEAVLFAPGIDGLCRTATDAEASLWRRLAAKPSLHTLLAEGHQMDTIAGLIAAGALDCEPG